MTPAQRTRATRTARAAASSPATHGVVGGSSLSVILVWTLGEVGVQMPNEVAQAFTGLAIFAFGWASTLCRRSITRNG